MSVSDIRPGSPRAWLLASRPQTLLVGIVPVVVGTAIAHGQGGFHLRAALAALLGAVAIQLALAVGRARFIATCSSCRTTYLRDRQAPRGRANYCQRCGLQAAWRDAQARRRASAVSSSKRRKRAKQE